MKNRISRRRLSSQRRHRLKERCSRSSRFFVEQLEDRRLLATYAPTTALDLPLAPGFVSAPTIESAQQDGSLSLREAIILANYGAGRDKIELQAGTTYQLSILGSNEDQAATGDLDIREDLDLVVNNGGSATVTWAPVAEGQRDRVFHIVVARDQPLVASSPLTTDDGANPATFATKLNDLDRVDPDFQNGDTVEITGTEATGAAVSATLTLSNADTATVGDLLTRINAAFATATASLTADGTLVLTSDSPSVSDQLSLSLSDGFFNTGLGNWPSFDVAGTSTVDITGVRIQGGRADLGAGLYNTEGTVSLTNSELSGNVASDRGGAIYNESGQVTLFNSAIIGNRAQIKDAPFSNSVGLVTLTNSRLAENTVGIDLSGEQFLEDVSGLLLDNQDAIIDGIDRFFDELIVGLEAAYTSDALANLPLLGTNIRTVLGPMISDLERFRSDTVDFLANVLDISPDADAIPLSELLQNALYLALGPGSGGFAGLTPAVQAALYEYQDQIGTLGLGILQDGADAGSDVNATDILVTLGHDEVGNSWAEFNLHVGQQFIYDLPSFNLGLDAFSAFLADGGDKTLFENFAGPLNFSGSPFSISAQSSSGIRADMKWDLRLGFGVSTLIGRNARAREGFYLNSGATLSGRPDDDPIEELRFSIDVFAAPASEAESFRQLFEDVVTTPNLSTTVSLGLIPITISDGTPGDVAITAPVGLPIQLFGSPAGGGALSRDGLLNLFAVDVGTAPITFQVVVDDNAPVSVTYQQSGPESLPFFLLKMNDAIADAFSGSDVPILNIIDSPVSFTVDFSPIDTFFNPGAPTTPFLVLKARDPAVSHLTITGAEAFGYLGTQYENRRVLGVGFGNNTASVPAQTDGTGQVLEQSLLADLPAPAEGISIQDPDFQIWIGGQRQVELSSSRPLTTGLGSTAATDSTPLNSLDFIVDNYDAGDEIFITGTGVNGAAVDATFAFPSGGTVGDLLTAINNAFPGATASLATDGTLQLAPDSGSATHQLSLTLSDFQGNRYPVFQRLTEGGTPIRVNFREILNRNIATLEQLRDKLNDIIQSEVASITAPGTSVAYPLDTVELQIDGDRFKLVSKSFVTGGTLVEAPLLTVTFRAVDQTKLSLSAGIDVISPGFIESYLKDYPRDQRNFNRVAIADIVGAADKTDILSPFFQAEAEVRLHATTDPLKAPGFSEQFSPLTDISLALPVVDFDIKFDAEANLAQLLKQNRSGDGDDFYDLRLVFDNIQLDVARFVDKVVIPIAESIADLLEPVLSVVGHSADDAEALLNKRLGVISDIVDEDVTLRTILAGIGIDDDVQSIIDYLSGAANAGTTLVDKIRNDLGDWLRENASEGKITFGGLELVLDPDNPLYFPRTKIPIPSDLGDIANGIAGLGADNFLRSFTVLNTFQPPGFSVDLFRPATMIDLLTGQPFNIISFGLPTIDADAGVDFGFQFDDLEFQIAAAAAFDSNFRLVYDSKGIEQIVDALRAGRQPDWTDLLDGLAIQNNPNGFELGGSVSFDGSGSITIEDTDPLTGETFVYFDGSGYVSIAASLGLELHDPNNDGKLRLDEILQITDNFSDPLALFCIFDVLGSFSVNVGGSVTILNVPVAEGDIGLTTGELSLQELLSSAFGICLDEAEPPVLGTLVEEDGQTVLRINTGPYAAERLNGDTSDESDPYQRIVENVDGSATLFDEYGLQIEFDAPNSDGLYLPVNTDEGSFLRKVGGTFKRYFPELVTTGSATGDVVTFDEDELFTVADFEATAEPGVHRIRQLTDYIGATTTYSYVDGELNQVVVTPALSGDSITTQYYVGVGNAAGLQAESVNGVVYVWGYGVSREDAQIFENVDRILAKGGSFDDVFDFSGIVGIPVDVAGRDGNDTLTGGSGDDSLEGGAGNDILTGNAGNDSIVVGTGDNTVSDGPGDDLIDFSRNGSGIVYTTGGGNDTVRGTDFDDTIIALPGDSGDVYFDGGRGDDTLIGAEGDDLLVGGRGHDILVGNLGNDLLKGGSGNDDLSGGEGDDRLEGDRDDDTLHGGLGADQLFAGQGDDRLTAGLGDLHIEGASGTDALVFAPESGHVATLTDFEYRVAGGTDTPYFTVESIEVQLSSEEETLTIDGPTLPLAVSDAGDDDRVIVVSLPAAVPVDRASGATNLRIPSTGTSGTVTSALEVNGILGRIVDLDVRLNIEHTFDADLDVFLISPSGTRVELFTDVGGSGDGFADTILDDQAAVGINSGIVPLTGRFRPEGSLASLNGEEPNGTWTLEITDDSSGDTGLLRNWTLTFVTSGEFSLGSGDDTLTVIDSQRVLTVDGQGLGDNQNGDRLVVDRSADPVPRAGLLTESLVRGLGTADIHYAGVEFLNLNLGTSSDRLDVRVANSATTRTTFHGGPGDEQVFVYSLAKIFDSLSGAPIVTATIDGQAGTDRVTVVIPGNPNLLTEGEFANLGFAVEELRIDNTQNTTATASWMLKNSSGGAKVYVVNGITETMILDTLGAATTIFDAGGAVGTDRLTVRDDVDAPQTIAIDGSHIEVQEGANVLFFDSHTLFDGFDFNATIDGLDGASDVAVAPGGDYVYVTGKVDDAVLVLRRTANSNQLEFVQVIRDGQFNVDGLDGASSIVISPDVEGRYVYVGSENDQAVAVFERVPQTGRLVFRGKFTNANVGSITHLAISPNGSYLYGTNAANEVFRLSIASPTSLAFGEKRSGWATGYTGIAVGLDGQNVFTSSNTQLSHLFVGASGVLPNIVTSSSSVAYRDVAVGPGNTVYGAFDGGIRVFQYSNAGLGAAVDTENWVNSTNIAQATALAVDADSGRVVASFDDTTVNPNPDTFQIQLISLYHIFGQDKFDTLTDDDEIYIEIAGVRVFGPSTFVVDSLTSDEAETRDLTSVAPVTISGSATVKLWEQDDGQGDEVLVNNDDLLGSRTVTTPTTGDSDSYTISWSVQDAATGDISRAILTFEVRRIAGSTPTTEPVLTFVRNTASGALSSPWQVNFNAANKLDAMAASTANSDFYGTNASGDFLALFSGAGNAAALQRTLTDGAVQNGLEYLAQPGSDDVETVISPDGSHAYSISGKYGLIMLARRDSATGALQYVNAGGTPYQLIQAGLLGDAALGTSPDIDMSRDGQYVYVTNPAEDSLLVYTRNATTGLLTLDQVFTDGLNGVDGLDGASSIAVSVGAAGHDVYVIGAAENAISHFSRLTSFSDLVFEERVVAADLTAPSSLALFPSATNVEVDPSFVYVTSAANNKLLVFSRNASGDLAYAPALSVTDGLGGVEGLSRPVAVALSNDFLQTHVYVAGQGDDAIAVFRRDAATGGLTFVQQVKDGDGGVVGIDNITSLIVSRDNQFVFATGGTDTMAVFKRDGATGALTMVQRLRNGSGGVSQDGPMQVVAGLERAMSLALSPDGAQLYVSTAGADIGSGGVAVFDVEQSIPEPARFVVDYSAVEDLTVQSAGSGDVVNAGEVVIPFTLNTQAGPDYVTIRNTGPNTTTTIRLGDDGDVLDLMGTGIGSTTTVRGNGGDDDLHVYATTAGSTLTELFGDSGDDTFLVKGGHLDSQLTIHGNVPNFGDNPAPDPGDTLIFDAHGLKTSPITPLPSAGTVQISGSSFGATYDTIERIVIIGSPLAKAGGPYAISEGGSLTFASVNTSGSSIPSGQTLVSLEWFINNQFMGSTTSPSEQVSATWEQLRAAGIDDDGVYQVAARITTTVNGEVFSDIGTATLTIANTAPTLLLTGASTTEAGSVYSVSLSATDPGADKVQTWKVLWGDGSGEETYFGSPATVQHVYATTGTFTIQVRAWDEDGGPYGPVAKLVGVAASRAISAGTNEVAEGAPFTLDLTKPATASISTWTIYWGDGAESIVAGGTTGATHTYADEGTYRIDATTVDSDGRVRQDLVPYFVNVFNVAPEITNLTPVTTTVHQGELLTSVVEAFDPGVEDILTYEYDFDGNGSFETLAALDPATGRWEATFAFAQPGTFTVPVRVRDNDGGVSQIRTFEVSVNNVGPTIDGVDVLTGDLYEATPIILTVRANDPGGFADPLLYEYDFDNDGVYEQDSLAATARHVYSDNGQYIVNVRVTDGSGATDFTSITLDVLNLPPTATAPAPDGKVQEGIPSVYYVGASDPAGANDPLSVAFDFDGDGLFESPAVFNVATNRWEAAHTFADDTFPPDETLVDGQPIRYIDVRVTDGDGGETITRAGIKVFNVAPTIALAGADSVAEGQVFTLTLGNVTDPGTDTVTKYIVYWGDGTSDTYDVPGPVTHVYQGTLGWQIINVHLVDEDVDYAGIQATHPLAGEHNVLVSGVAIIDRTLFILGFDDDDLVTVNEQGNGLTKVHASFFVGTNFKTFPTANFDRIVIYLNGGDDHVNIGGSVSKPVIIDGGNGNDHLSGGGAGNIILGSPGDDVLIGGAGRDILIGGEGRDRLSGQQGEDVLIGGFTQFDNDIFQWPNLNALLQEWTSGRDFAARTSNLTYGTGPILVSSQRLMPGETVFDDMEVDRLNGGPSTDWFFATAAGPTADIIVDSSAGDSLVYTNPAGAMDVNNDGRISAIDALLVINAITRYGSRRLPLLGLPDGGGEGESVDGDAAKSAVGFIDVNGDGALSPRDALLVINHLNRNGTSSRQAGAEGESDASFVANRDFILPFVASPHRTFATVRNGQSTAPARRWNVSSSHRPTTSVLEPIGQATVSPTPDADQVFADWDHDEETQGDAVTDDLATAVAKVWAAELDGTF